jgi:hypothetical protein
LAAACVGCTLEALLTSTQTPTRSSPLSWDKRMAKIKAKYTRAYGLWSPAEEDQLVQLIKSGKTTAQIAMEL